MSKTPPDDPFDEDLKKKPLIERRPSVVSQAEAEMEIEDVDSLGKKQAQSMASEENIMFVPQS